MTRKDRRMIEPGDLAQPQAPHHGLGRLVEHGGYGPDLVHAEAAEGDVQRRGGGLGRVAAMPGMPGEPPADLRAARAWHVIGHWAQAGEADELAAVGDFEGPEAIPLQFESRLDAIDKRIAGLPVERRREEPHGLWVGIECRERLPIRIEP